MSDVLVARSKNAAMWNHETITCRVRRVDPARAWVRCVLDSERSSLTGLAGLRGAGAGAGSVRDGWVTIASFDKRQLDKEAHAG